MGKLSLDPPAILSPGHDLSGFDCGVAGMNDWLRRRALKWQKSGGTRVIVLTGDSGAVRAFYALATGQVRRAEAPSRMARNTPDPLPVIVLGRLAVDRRWQGRGVARSLLLDAFDRVLAISRSVGVVALMVHALNPDLVPFYRKFGFAPAPGDDSGLTLFKRVRDIAAEAAPDP